LVEVVLAHYQEPAEELAGTLRAALVVGFNSDLIDKIKELPRRFLLFNSGYRMHRIWTTLQIV
jgi:hypothetical protein